MLLELEYEKAIKLGFKGRGIYGLRSINYEIADIKLLVKIIFWLLHEKGILTLLVSRTVVPEHGSLMLGGNQKVQATE